MRQHRILASTTTIALLLALGAGSALANPPAGRGGPPAEQRGGDDPPGRPDDVGRPDDAGRPDHAGRPDDTGRPPWAGAGARLRAGRLDVCDGEATLVGPDGQAGQSHVAHTDFAPPAEDPESVAGEGDAWGRMTYFWVGSRFDFVFNGHQVEPGVDYTLAVDAGDGTAICLAEATANGGGQVHAMGSIEADSHLPADLDPFEPVADDEPVPGATAWLIATEDVDCETGVVADDAVVLESTFDIRFVDVDELECPAP